jgi:rhodanese-related sulfurtransferase
MLKKSLLTMVASLALLAVATNAFAGVDLPDKKKTVLGLYVNSQQAYAMWKAHPENVTVIDVRTPEEYSYIGHAPMAYNIPSKFMILKYNEKKKTYNEVDNKDFVDEVQKNFSKNQTLLLMCRSGHRSASAANLLANAGYKNVYTIYDGFEGDKVKDELSYYKGQRMVNGWKNSGNPWTYEGDKSLMYFPKK